MVPYYQDEQTCLYHGDCREVLAWLEADVLLVDPPYGIDYDSGSPRDELAASIEGDKDTTVRDDVLALWGDRPALVFGTWRIPRPDGVQERLIWDSKGALGMGDLSIPWKRADQEIYVLGHTTTGGFRGHRSSNVLVCPPVQSMARNGRLHPHEKPVPLLAALIEKCPPGVLADPCAGSGSLGVAAKLLGRKAVLVESDARYLDKIVRRLDQGALTFDGEAS
jgi:DNA modification methylase